MTQDSKDKALLIGKALAEKKGKDLLVLDVHALTTIADYFVLVSGRSIRQVQALASYVEDSLQEHKIKPLSREGTREGSWVLLDYGDVIVHVLYHPARDFYNLEGLWIKAPVVDLGIDGKAEAEG